MTHMINFPEYFLPTYWVMTDNQSTYAYKGNRCLGRIKNTRDIKKFLSGKSVEVHPLTPETTT